MCVEFFWKIEIVDNWKCRFLYLVGNLNIAVIWEKM